MPPATIFRTDMSQYDPEKVDNPRPLLWVNKTAESKSLSNVRGTPAHHEVLSHVHKFHDRRARPSKSPTTRSLPLRIEPKGRLILPPKTPPTSHVDGMFDPFDSLPIKLDAEGLALLKGFISHTNPAGCHLAVRAQSPRAEKLAEPLRAEILKGCMENPIVMSSFVASMASFAEHTQKVIPQGSSATLLGKAMASLQQDLSATSTLSHEHLLAVTHLMTAEAYMGNFAGARVHLRAAKRLTHMLGGLPNMSLYVRHTLIAHDLFLAIESLSKPLFPADFDPGPLPEALVEKVRPVNHVLERYGSSLQARQNEEVFGDAMVQIIGDMIEATKGIFYMRLTGYCELDLSRWCFLRMAGVRHQLLTIVAGDARKTTLRLSLLLWTLIISPSVFSTRAIPSVVTQLKEALANCSVSDWSFNPDLLKWIFLSGTLAGEFTLGEVWYSRKLATAVDQQDAATSEMQRVMAQFLSHDLAFGAGLRKIAEMICAE